MEGTDGVRLFFKHSKVRTRAFAEGWKVSIELGLLPFSKSNPRIPVGGRLIAYECSEFWEKSSEKVGSQGKVRLGRSPSFSFRFSLLESFLSFALDEHSIFQYLELIRVFETSTEGNPDPSSRQKPFLLPRLYKKRLRYFIINLPCNGIFNLSRSRKIKSTRV